MSKPQVSDPYWKIVWQQFKQSRLGMGALTVLVLICLIGIYAPLFASSKPLFVIFDHHFYFPLFRYLFYPGFYTKPIDLFFNLFMFTLPLGILGWSILPKKGRRFWVIGLIFLQFTLLLIFERGLIKDPARNLYTETGSKLDQLLKYRFMKHQHDRLAPYGALYQEKKGKEMPTLWQIHKKNGETEGLERWLETESQKITFIIPPLLKEFHWEEDAGGSQAANQFIPWWELTRVNRKDLVASLLFGIRVSIVVGFSAAILTLLIGIPLGMLSGYFVGKTDLVICRMIEMWEAMPTFFMLLLIIAITQNKSIFLVITVLGLFGWTGIARFIRSEVLKQRGLPYVTACQSLGFTSAKTMFSHILPNAIPPVLTLLPFTIMGAITSEAGLSFLGLGEEGSTSWGVLMDEGRSVFPAESYLLWPPAILLSTLLIAIALVGDRLRDAIDPKMH